MENKPTLDWLKNLSKILNSTIEKTNSQIVSINISKNMAQQMANDIQYIEQTLTTKSKKELALDIIKNKGVDASGILGNHKVEKYNSGGFRNKLTQEEFNLLKEVLEDAN